MKHALLTLTACILAGATLASPGVAQTPDVAIPALVDFSASVAGMRTVLEPVCTSLAVHEFDVADLPIAEHSHTQIDCTGFLHAGQPRLAEFVFADDVLAFVWILTTQAEEASLHDALTARFGSPSHTAEGVIAYVDHQVALRRDTPELLYYSENFAPEYREWFDQMAQ